MPDIEDLCCIPGAGESPDPCEGNPFPISDMRHEVWADATRKAEGELSLLKVELLKRRCASPGELANFILDLRVGSFHIWARRGVRVVWGDFNIAPYDNWLVAYAESILKQALEHYADRGLLTELRVRLFQGIECWKAEARRYVSQQTPEMHLGDEAFSKSDQSATDSAGEPKPDESTRAEAELATGQGPKRGARPISDLEAHQVAEIVERVVADGDLSAKLDALSIALDHGICDAADPDTCDIEDHPKIPLPRGWKVKGHNWLNPPDNVALLKAIRERVQRAGIS